MTKLGRLNKNARAYNIMKNDICVHHPQVYCRHKHEAAIKKLILNKITEIKDKYVINPEVEEQPVTEEVVGEPKLTDVVEFTKSDGTPLPEDMQAALSEVTWAEAKEQIDVYMDELVETGKITLAVDKANGPDKTGWINPETKLPEILDTKAMMDVHESWAKRLLSQVEEQEA